MVSFLVRMRFDAGDRDAIEATLRSLAAASRLEPGCISYVPHFVEGDANTVVIYEQYKDEAALEFHRKTPHFHEHAIGGLYQKMKDRAIEDLTAVD
jgi:quinol monooxygenase YgiN